MELVEIASRVEAYDPKLSPDNRADELALHDIVMATGKGSLTVPFDQTFVRSLDAAMTLVPEGATWELSLEGTGTAGAVVYAPIPNEPGYITDEPVEAATPALALTAASLKALATQERGE